ncbi:subunit 7 of WASH complex [Chloropicon primus]|uniref:Subunit 7 of WASH complex n=1 Tax=Chloropicon primus TaxID=1764295 RepID=A0A5B8MFS2_9CHLO|nr:subunit 7 of WASH complex [Chloropicon primus]UPQ97384.1 subunit 7 of WASH complex [Chloropicon primus]|eukprot:QDZ18172.1 subunit 7 of WASH complex [Chloropicon primus]
MASLPLPGETLAAIEEEFESFRRLSEEFIDGSKGLLVDLEPFSGETSGQFHLENKVTRPIKNVVLPKRREPLNKIVEGAETGNDAVEKIILVFGFLRNEVRILKEKALETTVPFLLLFGESMEAEGDNNTVKDGDGHLKFAKGIKGLIKALELVERTRDVLTNLVRQCYAVHADSGDNLALYKTFQDAGLKSVMMSIGTCLYILLLVDSAIRHNPLLLTCSSMFQGTLSTLSSQPEKYGLTSEEVDKLTWDLQNVDRLISSQGNFQSAIEHVLTEIEVSSKSIKSLLKQMHAVVSESLSHCIQRNDHGVESPYENEILLQNLCLTILYTWISGDTTDKKVLRLSTDVSKAIPVVPLYGHMILVISDMLEQLLHPSWLKEKPSDFKVKSKKNQLAFLAQLDETFVSRSRALIKSLTSWCITVDDEIPKNMNSTDVFAYALKTLKDGLHNVGSLQGLLVTFLELHTQMEKPVNKVQIKMVCQAAAMLKIVERVFNKRSAVLLQMIPYILSTVQAKMFSILEPLRRKLEADIETGPKKGLKGLLSSKDADEMKLDAYALVTIALHALDGQTSSQRIALVSLIFDLLKDLQQIKGDKATDLMVFLSLLNLMYEYEKLLDAKCDCSFLIFSSDILGKFLTEVFEDFKLHSQVYYVVNAFHDGQKLIAKSGLENECMVTFSKNLEKLFLTSFVEPLHRMIENDLRFHLHSERIEGMTRKNPLEDKQSDITPLLGMSPIAFHTSLTSIRDQITHYLNQTFYNHTAIGLQNWKTYNEMLNLAGNKYGLRLSEIHLPQHTLEQGLDVLEIMRNIHIFVIKYNYNLHLQTFVEKLADSVDRKHLNTISIRHIANSIRSHGIGIVNTTINYVYQYLTKKLEVLTTFLYDDHIKSRLKREMHFFSEKQEELDHEYPFERAVNFNKDIRKLGVTNNGMTYMDKFREAITEVGNALGFVRMMRLGAMRYCSQATEFLPTHEYPSSGEENLSFTAQAQGEMDDTLVLDCTKQVDSLVENLQTKSAETLDYLNLLVSVFSKELCNERFSHLQDFHIIIPSVTLNAVESLLRGKEKLSKRGVDSEATFSDDGFALGLAYLLRVLKQVKVFNDIHWFDAVRKYYVAEKEKLLASKQTVRRSSFFGGKAATSEEAHNTQLLLARHEGHLEEFNFLEWTLRAANTFFHNQ